jgi:pimeloyl-ACP methyl ester carboxylesterase
MKSRERAPTILGLFALASIFLSASLSVDGWQAGRPIRFTVSSDQHPIAVWGRPPERPWASALLVHGRTWSARPDFDLQVPGLERSVLSSLAARGVAAYAVDLRGYGETPSDRSGWLTPRRASADLLKVLAWIAERHPSLPLPALVGWSRGAAVAMMAASASPARASRLVISGFAYDPDLRFTNAETPRTPPRIANTAEDAGSDFQSPAVTSPAVVRAFAEQALASDPFMANLRNDAELNAIAPARITMPVLLIFGERDPGVNRVEADKLISRIASRDKRLLVLPGADHAAHLEDTHAAWIDAVVDRLK